MGKLKLRDYQKEALKELEEYLKAGNGNPIVCMATGTGKSLVIAEFIRGFLCKWPHLRFLMLTHKKELVDQNEKEMLEMWPTAPIGVFSAGLRRRDTQQSVIYGTVNSVYNNINLFGKRHIIVVDESHLISEKTETTYRKLIDHFRKRFKKAKIVGFTATPFRLGQGMLTEIGIFDEIVFDNTTGEKFTDLIKDGYLSNLVVPQVDQDSIIDTSNIDVSGGEYNLKQMREEASKDKITMSAIKQTIVYGKDRVCWLVYTASIAHCEKVYAILKEYGVSCGMVHSKMKHKHRDNVINMHRRGDIKCLVNANMLTTGYNNRKVDLISILFSTKSVAKWVQVAGRGTRISPETGKKDCIILDFGRNCETLGPVNDPILPRKSVKSGGDAPVKVCPSCSTYSYASARFCEFCNYEFPQKPKHKSKVGTATVIKTEEKVTKVIRVKGMRVQPHHKKGGKTSMKVSYFSDQATTCVWVCLEHEGGAFKIAEKWWQQHCDKDMPKKVSEAVNFKFKQPKRIHVVISGKWPKVNLYEF